MVRNALPDIDRRFAAPDIQEAVDLHRIGRDDFKDVACKRDRKVRFARGGGPDDNDGLNRE